MNEKRLDADRVDTIPRTYLSLLMVVYNEYVVGIETPHGRMNLEK